MAGAARVAGRGAAFWIVPLAGAVLVLTTYGLGRRLGDPLAGLIGAWLVATSPVVLLLLMQPMTDVPVAAAWSTAWFFLLGSSWRSAAAAGLATALAILIRPNLVPLAAILGAWYLLRRPRAGASRFGVPALGAFAWYTGMAAIGAVATAAINRRLYGSPFVSGYGDLAALFGWAHVLPNLRSYTAWLVEAQTPLALAGVLAVAAPLRRFWPGVADRRILLISGLFVLVLWAQYVAYLEFDDWSYLRFLLPCWPILMIGMGGVALAIARGHGSPGRVLAVAGLLLCLGVYEYRLAGRSGAFTLWRVDRAPVLVARRVRDLTEPNAVVFSMFHSGSLRYYGGRMTLRFDLLDQAWLDRSVAWLSARGAHPYLLVNDWEIPQFLARFPAQRTIALIGRPPVFSYQGYGGTFLFDLAPRGAPAPPVEAMGLTGDLRAAPPAPPPQLVLQ